MVPEAVAALTTSASWPWADLVLHVGERWDGEHATWWAVATGGDQVAFALRLSLGVDDRERYSGSIHLDPGAVVLLDHEVAILTEHHGYLDDSATVWSVVLTRDGVQRARVSGILDPAHPPRREGRFLRLQRRVDLRHPEPVVWVDLSGVDVTYEPAAYGAVAHGHRVTVPFRRVGRCGWSRGEALSDGRPVIFLALPAMDEAARARMFEAWGASHGAPLPGVLSSRGWCPSPERGAPWLLVFDGRKGVLLSEQVSANRPLAPARARRALEGVAGILAEAHDRGRFHGYLWPGGVGLHDDDVWLRDVGLDLALTGLGLPWPATPGSLPAEEPWAFAAPEVLLGGGDARSDVWSFGLLAYYLRSGARYWRSERDSAALRAEILRGKRPLPSVRARRQRVDDVVFPDAAFDAWFGRCVVRDPARRFRDLREAAAALPW